MEYNSDYSVRLATLEALGGDVTKCYDSVYAIDLAILEAIEQGGGGEGMNYNQIKAALAASGVTEITVNGDGDSIILDYDLLSQIGQGGMDYNEIKAALAASGLTSILVLDGSGHTKEMDYALLDQIGEVDFSKVQSGLTNTGVTDIKFVSGSTSAITLDYDLISQIGQGGGGDYIIVNTIDELSGITNPKDGMIAYVGAHYVQEEAMAITADWYNGDSDWCHFNLDFGSGTTATFGLHNNGENMYVDNGYFTRNGDSWFWNIPSSRSELPAGFAFHNGIEGVLASNVNGEEYSEHNEYANTVYIYKYNGVLPSVTLNQDDNINVIFTGTTVETVSRFCKGKGAFKYYLDIDKWLAYNINLDNLTSDELNTVCYGNAQYQKPLFGEWKQDGYTFVGHCDYMYGSGDTYMYFTSPLQIKDNFQIHYARMTREDGEGTSWHIDDKGHYDMVSQDSLNANLNRRIVCQPRGYMDSVEYGTIYNVAAEGTLSGTVHYTTVSFDPTATGSSDYNEILAWSSDDGRYGYDFLRNNGYWRNEMISMIATENAEWTVVDYTYYLDENANKIMTAVLAVKVEDNGDDTFTLYYFNTPHINVSPYDDRGYTWTEEQNQTITFTPTLYGIKLHLDSANNAHKVLYKQNKTAVMTEAEYQSLTVVDPNTIYYLTSNN